MAEPRNYIQGPLFINASERPEIQGRQADAANAIAISIGSEANYTTSGSKLIEITNSGVQKGYIDKDGNAAFRVDYIRIGDLPTGLNNNYGVYTPTTTHTLGLVSTKSSEANGVSIGLVADVDNATIDENHKIFRAGWINNSDVYTEVFNLKPSSLELTNNSAAEILSTQLNSPTVTAITLGTENVFTLPTTVSGLQGPCAKILSLVNGSPGGSEKFKVDITGNVGLNELPNGQAIEFKSISEEATISGSATTDLSNVIIPSGTLVYAVSSRVTASIPGTDTFSIGVPGATTRYGTSLLSTVGSTWKGIDAGVTLYTANTYIRVTPNAVPSGETGKIRITLHYIDVTAPTS